MLHIHRADWRILDGFKTANLKADTNTLSRQHVRSVAGDNAYRMDTVVGNIPYEVSTVNPFQIYLLLYSHRSLPVKHTETVF
jgi:16S rRNA A1518/A1519 N6-dimethyltransferase RsmA/KsgA/DIM1 with predicted DNA glycosylase/AP lyase activity